MALGRDVLVLAHQYHYWVYFPIPGLRVAAGTREGPEVYVVDIDWISCVMLRQDAG